MFGRLLRRFGGFVWDVREGYFDCFFKQFLERTVDYKQSMGNLSENLYKYKLTKTYIQIQAFHRIDHHGDI